MNGEKLNFTLDSYSSLYTSEYPVEQSFDGSTSTRWRAQGSKGEYLIVKVDSPIHLTGFRIYPEVSSYGVDTFTLSISNDNMDFKDVYSGQCSRTASWVEYEFESDLVGNYIKLTASATSSDRLSVYEFELYGEPASAEPEVSVEYGIIGEPSSYETSNSKWELGWEFTVGSEDINVSGLRIKLCAVQVANSNLWLSDGTLLKSINMTAVTGDWVEAYFDESITLTSGTTYVISFYRSANGYKAHYSDFTFNPKITYVTGRYGKNAGEFPVDVEENMVYPLIDIIIETGGSSEPEEPEEPKIYTHTIDFTDPEWKTQRSDVFSVTDGTTPFFVDSTLPYDGKTTLRSGAIGNSGISETTINFTLIADGSIELNYTVSSESNYDWLRISVDDTEVVTVSGSVSWTVYTKDLSAGDHVVKFKYTKDGSSSSGSDAGAIGYVTLTGVVKDYDRKYLIQSGTSLFTVTNGVLTAVTGSVNAELFRTHGADEVPSSELLITLADPVVLYWVDTFEHPIKPLVAVEHAVPFEQVVKSPDYSMRHPSITGIEKAIVVASDDVGFAVSFDSGDTWMVWTGSAWGTLSEGDTGMSAETMNSITSEDWNSVATTGTFKFRAVLPTLNSTITSLVVDYLN